MNHSFVNRLRAGEQLTGTMITLDSPAVIELLSNIGFDWLFIDAARAQGGVLGMSHDFSRLLSAVDHGHDDPGSASVERFLDVDFTSNGEANEAGGIAASHLQETLDVGRRHGTMLGVDEEPVEANIG